MRADLVGLGVRLGWVAPDATEEPALAAVFERLRDDGDGVLLIYDNANNPNEIRKYLPRAGTARIIVTSNAPNWGGVAAPVEIEIWPKEVGADYLIARTGRRGERDAGLALSEILGGLPLAHEQAAAYCERLGINFSDYRKRFEGAPSKLLDAEKDAPAEYHDRLTVAKTFALAIDEAAKLHPAAEPLIVYAALLAPEPIPLFLFSEACEKFAEPLASNLAGDGLDEAVAALRAFALVDRETIPDEREPEISTDCIRLHRLVRQVAAVRREEAWRTDARRALIGALAELYPGRDDLRSKENWVRARRLEPFPGDLLPSTAPPSENEGFYLNAIKLMKNRTNYLRGAAQQLDAEAQDIRRNTKKILAEAVLDIYKKAPGADHPDASERLKHFGELLERGDLEEARPYLEEAVARWERAVGPDRTLPPEIFLIIGHLLKEYGDLAGAGSYYERALAIREKVLGPADPTTLETAHDAALLLDQVGRQNEARALREKFGIKD